MTHGLTEAGLDGRRILVVEDSPLVADATEMLLIDFGCVVVGPATNLATARQLAEGQELDAALVDLNIRGAKSFSILEILQRRGIPFALTSGYADWSMPAEWQNRPRLPKPYTENMLHECLRDLCAN